MGDKRRRMRTATELADFGGATAFDAAARVAEIARHARPKIDPRSGLANDFLNQFHELSLLLESVCGDIASVDDLGAWRGAAYRPHFEHSQFADRDLIIEAYDLLPETARRRFDDRAAELMAILSAGMNLLWQLRDRTPAALPAAAQELSRELRHGLSGLEALIRVGNPSVHPADVAAMFEQQRA